MLIRVYVYIGPAFQSKSYDGEIPTIGEVPTMKIKLCLHYAGSIFGPVRKPTPYNVNDARGNRTGPLQSRAELFTSYQMDMFWIGNIRFRSKLTTSPRQ